MGDPASLLLGLAQIRILVVPVHPIRRDTFQTYFHLLSQFACVALPDLTPPDSRTNKFTEQLYHDGFLHLRFVTDHHRDHAALEEIQLNRQVLGVIGIMHCQQAPSLAQGHKRFQQILQRYPSALAQRCFGFEPSDAQADDVKGLIMIPNVGDISFYLQTMINDFTSDLLLAFGSLAGQIERRSMISGPLMVSPMLQLANPPQQQQQQQQQPFSPAMPSSAATASIIGSPASAANTLAPPTPAASSAFAIHMPPSAHFAGGPLPADRSRESSAGNPLTHDTPVSALGMTGVAPPGTQQLSIEGGNLSSANLSFGFGNLLNPDKARKRTPARIQKLLGDLYLLAGRLDLAMSCFYAAIEGIRGNSDWQWLAAAQESLCCAQLLSLAIVSGIGPAKAYDVPSESDNPQSPTSPTRAKRSSIALARGLPSTSDILHAAVRSNTSLGAMIAELPERYRDIVQLYERAYAYGTPGFYPILQIQASLRMAYFLADVHANRILFNFANGAGVAYWSVEPKSIGAEIAARIGSSGVGAGAGGGGGGSGGGGAVGGSGGSGVGGSGGVASVAPVSGSSGGPAAMHSMLQTERIMIQNGLGASRFDVLSWIMRAWHSGFDYLTLTDQLASASSMAAVCGLVGADRKHAFFLRQTAMYGVALAHRLGSQAEAAIGVRSAAAVLASASASAATAASAARRGSADQGDRRHVPASGPLECLRRVCDLLGIHAHDDHGSAARRRMDPFANDVGPASDDEDPWLDEYENDDDLPSSSGTSASQAVAQPRTPSIQSLLSQSQRIVAPSVRRGSPALQISVLKECIDVAHSQGEHLETVLFIARLLRLMYRHITKRDQMQYADLLKQVVLSWQAGSALVTDGGMAAGAAASADSADSPAGDASESDVAGALGPGISALLKSAGGDSLGIPVLRQIVPIKQPARQAPVAHQRSVLDGSDAGAAAASGRKDVFIYNPFANRDKNAKSKASDSVVLVAGEMFYVDVVLANPFVFEIDVQKLALFTSGVPIKTAPIATVVPPETRSHTVRLSGVPLGSGTLHIHGCLVRILGGCIEEHVMPVRRSLDIPRMRTKDGKRHKQDDRSRFGKRKIEFMGKPERDRPATAATPPRGKRWSMPLKVVRDMPTMELQSTSLGGHQALMLFEGERSTFRATVRNIGATPVTYLNVTINESVDAEAAAATAALGFLAPYEQDIHVRSTRAFWLDESDTAAAAMLLAEQAKLRPTESALGVVGRIAEPQGVRVPVTLAPGESVELVFGVFGKRDCTGATIVIDYANLENADRSDSVFYARQIVLPVLLTVQPVLAAYNVDFLLHSHDEQTLSGANSPLGAESAERSVPRADSIGDMVIDPRLSDAVMDAMPSDDQVRTSFVLTFDLHNSWNEPLQVRFDMYEDDSSDLPTGTYRAIIHSGVAKRIILPLSRVRLPKSVVHQAIPTPSWKQYILDKTKVVTPEGEALRRAVFWYREYLVGGLNHRGRILAHWRCSKDRFGVMQMRGFTITERMLHVLKSESISMVPTLAAHVVGGAGDGVDAGDAVVRVRPDFYTCRIRSYARLEWRITNLKDAPVNLFLRIVPIQEDAVGAADANMASKLVIMGALEAPLPRLAHGESTAYAIRMRFLSLARVRFVCHVEEIERPPKRGAAPAAPPKKSKHDPAVVVLGSIERLHWDRDGVVVQSVEAPRA
ncbi:hypothetical protein HK105_204739 [Polyrhizophydium stewartii]|uniref:Uncharacterized protein n=1 Tax=Polyrhizophydium stewartii TaxID=2732419 RepID=A0ABR4N8G6_9FUNG